MTIDFDGSVTTTNTLDVYCILHALTNERLVLVTTLENREYRGKPAMVIPKRYNDMTLERLTSGILCGNA